MNASFALTNIDCFYSWGKNNDAVLGLKKKMDRRNIVYKPTEITFLLQITLELLI